MDITVTVSGTVHVAALNWGGMHRSEFHYFRISWRPKTEPEVAIP